MEMLIAIKFSMCKKEKRILLVLQIGLFMQNIFFILLFWFWYISEIHWIIFNYVSIYIIFHENKSSDVNLLGHIRVAECFPPCRPN